MSAVRLPGRIAKFSHVISQGRPFLGGMKKSEIFIITILGEKINCLPFWGERNFLGILGENKCWEKSKI